MVVARHHGKFYVIGPLNADTEWNEKFVRGKIVSGDLKFTRDRGKALVIAHDIQSKESTEYGVWEMRIPHEEASKETDEE